MPTPNTRNKHEGAPEQAEGFRGDYSPSTQSHPKWRVSNAEREPQMVHDSSPLPDLTGRWMDEQFGCYLFINHVADHIELLIACVESGSSGLAKHQPRDKMRCETRLIRMGGDPDFKATEDSEGNHSIYILYLHRPDHPVDDKSQICGTLEQSGNFIQLALDAKGLDAPKSALERLSHLATRRVRRIDSLPVLFPRHLYNASVPHTLRTSYWFPLTPRQAKRLPGFILGERIEVASNYQPNKGGRSTGYIDLVRDYFLLHSGAINDTRPPGEKLPSASCRQYMANIARALDALVLKAYQAPFVIPAEEGGIDSFAIDSWRLATMRTLADTRIIVSGSSSARSLYQLTQVILDSQVGESAGNFEKYLYMRSTQGGHYYAANIAITGLSTDPKTSKAQLDRLLSKFGKKAKRLIKRITKRIPVGATVALLEVWKQDDPDIVPDANEHLPEWSANYLLVLGGIDGSADVGKNTVGAATSSGQAKHVYGQAWTPEQLEGPVRFDDYGGSFSAGPMGKGLSFSRLAMYGREGSGCPKTPLQLNFSGISQSFGWGRGGSISVQSLVGWAYYLTGDITNYNIGFEIPKQTMEYSGQTASAPLHFPINGAAPEFVACELLKVFAAIELAALSHPDCEIELHGHADQPGKGIKNLILSRNRAISVFNFLKSIAYTRMKLGPLKDVPSEKQELDDYAIEKEKNKEDAFKIRDPSTPQVKVTSHGEPPSENKDKPSKTYDAKHRRVDITLDQSTVLHLRRTDDGTGS